MLELNLPRQFNAACYFIDRNIDEGRGDKTAIISDDKSFTYSQVLENVNRVSNIFSELGVQMENRVMLLMRDTPEMIFSFYGAIRLGAIPVPTNILMKSQDFLYVLNDSRARLLVVDSSLLPEVEKIFEQARFLKEIIIVGGENQKYSNFHKLTGRASTDFQAAETKPDDVAFWLYSGRNPEKLMGAVHHHSHMVYCSEAYAKGILGMNENDKAMGSFLFFAYGLGNCVYFPFAAGATTIITSHRPTPDLVHEDLVKFRPTLFFTVPTLLGALADYKQACRNEGKNLAEVTGLRACISSAEILSPDVYRRFRKEFGVEILDGTGSTEICHIFLSNRFGDVKPGSTGKEVPGYHTRLIDEDGHDVAAGETGNLLVSGGSIASAYWNQREETKANMIGQWFITGDRYMVDEDGFYYFRGRSDDMLRIGGKWLAPQEVEKTINEHPAVTESAVVGFPDKDELIKPYAFVVLAKGHSRSEALENELKEHVKAKIASYKYPRWIEFVENIPKTAGGKIKRFVLQERVKKRG